MKQVYVFDTSAVLAYLRDESGADDVAALFEQKTDLSMHRVNLGELYYAVFRREGEEFANAMYAYLIQYPILYRDDLDDRFLLTVARFKVKWGLGYADAYAAASAHLYRATLVTKDNDFRPLGKAGVISVLWV